MEHLTGLANPASKPRVGLDDGFVAGSLAEICAADGAEFLLSLRQGSGDYDSEIGTGLYTTTVPDVNRRLPGIVPGLGVVNFSALFDSNLHTIDMLTTLSSSVDTTFEICYQPTEIQAGALMESGASGDGTGLGITADGRPALYSADNPTLLSGVVLEVGRTYHIVGLHERDVRREVYVNGRRVAASGRAVANANGSSATAIGLPNGAQQGLANVAARGYYGAPAGYRLALSAEQILRHFRATRIRRKR